MNPLTEGNVSKSGHEWLERVNREGMSKHTPGPWKVTGSASGGISVDAKDPADNRGFELCEVWGVDCDRDALKDGRAKANANLIAAAPDLLEACEMAVIDAVADDMDPWFAKIKAAIARAKGESQ